METVLIKLGVQQAYHIGESGEIAAARRASSLLAQKLTLGELRTAQLELVVTEVATNIAKHASEGWILLRSLQFDSNVGVEVVALDSGPGIANVSLQMEDGHSTTGTYGVGLGAIRRLTHEFDIYTQEGQGTVLRMALWADAAVARVTQWQAGCLCLSYPGEDVCGDDWAVECDEDIATFIVADGLGHGPDAAVASRAATDVSMEYFQQHPGRILQLAHGALHGTRGAAVAVGQIDLQQKQLRFAGVGNIAASVFESSGRRHLLSHNGIVGSNMRKVHEVVQAWEPGSILIAHSDGINTRWDLERYPGLRGCHPSLIAALIYRDFERGRDDVAILVLRESRVHP